MGAFKYTDPLETHMVPNPVLMSTYVELPDDAWTPTQEELDIVFGGPNRYLKTWKRAPDKRAEMDPHYIGAQKGVPLHIDPGFLRYTMQILFFVDEYELSGYNKVGLPLTRGTYFLLDTWSPHAVLPREDATEKPKYYLAASVDSSKPYAPEEAIPLLLGLLTGSKGGHLPE